MYFNYHGYLKKKIKNNQLVKWEFVDEYKNLGYVIAYILIMEKYIL